MEEILIFGGTTTKRQTEIMQIIKDKYKLPDNFTTKLRFSKLVSKDNFKKLKGFIEIKSDELKLLDEYQKISDSKKNVESPIIEKKPKSQQKKKSEKKTTKEKDKKIENPYLKDNIFKISEDLYNFG